MVFKKAKWIRGITLMQKEVLTQICGDFDAPHNWWNRFDGVKVYPDKDIPGFYTDETGNYLFSERWCEEEE